GSLCKRSSTLPTVEALRHVEVPVPKPQKDEVLIKMEAVSINPIDWKVQKGLIRPFLPRKFPCIPGTDVAGEVIEVGQGIKNFKSGDKTGGGLAEYIVAKESSTVARPPEVSAADGSSIPVAGVTAYQALTQPAGVKLDGSGDQKNILVTAASGGVGQYAVQLAKLGNTHVTATCGARNIELVKSLGADEVLDYKTPEGAALKSPSGRKYDAVIHCATGIPWSTFEPNLSENGKVIDLTPAPSAFVTSFVKKLTLSKKKLVPLFGNMIAEDIEFLVKLVKEGKLKTIIDSKHPLSKAEDAWAKKSDTPTQIKQAGTFLLVVVYSLVSHAQAAYIQKLLHSASSPLWKTLATASLLLDMAGKLMHAIRYDSYGGGAAALKSGGGLAELAVAKESLTVERPPEVSPAEAAGLPVAGLTALQALTQPAGVKIDGSGKQKNILITAASGGVGHYAVQLAKLGNTHVTATCGSRNIEFVKSLGADEVLDYKTPEGAALKSPSGRKYDAVIHCATPIPWSTFEPNLSDNGKVIDITPGPSAMITFALKKLTFSKKQLVPLLLIPKGENLQYLVKLVKEQKLKTKIDSKQSLSKGEDAWARIMDGHATGKIVVEP
ncbi:hypothetical protein Tsubulata_027372, partial [Turnera subulata]